MVRNLNGVDVRQDTKTEMICGTDLLNGCVTSKRMDSFKKLDSTKNFINTIAIEENKETKDIMTVKRVDGVQGTWMHPMLFMDFAMWLSADFKYKALSWLYDSLLEFRDNSGSSFKEYNKALTANFPEFFDGKPYNYAKVANGIALACKVGTGKDKWERATEEQLLKRDSIHKNITLLADVAPDVPTCLALAIKKA